MKCALWRQQLWPLMLLPVMFAQCAHAQAHPQTVEPFVIIEESGASGKIEPQKLAVALHLMIQQLHIEATELPTIVIYHISPRSARFIGLSASSIFRNTGSGNLRYEMWIIGIPSSHAYSYFLESMLEHHFNVSIGDEARSLAIREVEHALNMTMDARSF